ncbi:N-acetylmuramoyl-L-alanine amidase [Parvularcula dongshanensis]|uniref:N-acetylmuramoyl-L-alanine amidase n=1 Tax=Parvularcula dongshanensis TaxID=1173995 RepID=A0A840I700_9PROT|nr:N-acetylmuramoyl-L-alanine amidase [Parvularcula dongshanensis]MBB4660095.1 N-acetylmuramoyl-L-alanine amidase [Parvularcula dongshanensis]
MIDAPSPNHDERGVPVSMVVLHYTGMKTGAEALARLRDPAAKVSAHYMVEEDGRLYRLVPEERRAWHAGVAEWHGRRDVNAMSVGIEIVNPGHEFGYRDFPEVQMQTVLELLRQIRRRYDVAPENVVGHSDVAPDRKDDPGERFPWDRLAREALALAPWDGRAPDDVPEAPEALRRLARLGYGVEAFGSGPCVTAFQRRFAPTLLGEGLGRRTRAAIGAVTNR